MIFTKTIIQNYYKINKIGTLNLDCYKNNPSYMKGCKLFIYDSYENIIKLML